MPYFFLHRLSWNKLVPEHVVQQEQTHVTILRTLSFDLFINIRIRHLVGAILKPQKFHLSDTDLRNFSCFSY